MSHKKNESRYFSHISGEKYRNTKSLVKHE